MQVAKEKLLGVGKWRVVRIRDGVKMEVEMLKPANRML